jgi:ABC-type transport system involved in multi-copper enzyme maturation permease subunit
MSAVATPRPRRLGALRDVGTGIAAVGVKELRGRMRGRRAFVMLTIHLVIVAGFAWMITTLAERSMSGGFGGSLSASAEIGRTLFSALIMLLTLIVLVLAPASTAGAISLEREKQTLDLLTTTPISSLAIILGKLLSALSWVFLLLLASIPVTALVFTFGGVGPEDLVRAYVVLFATAIAFGSMGLFVSALVKRTQAATVINLVMTIVLTAGATFLFGFWSVMAAQGFLPNQAQQRDASLISTLTRRPPEVLLYFNPFVAQVDVICGTETGFGGTCQVIAAVTDFDSVANGGIGDQAFAVDRDTFWPRAAAAMIAAAVILVVLSVQLVSPTRRWRLRRGRRQVPPDAPAPPPVYEEIV